MNVLAWISVFVMVTCKLSSHDCKCVDFDYNKHNPAGYILVPSSYSITISTETIFREFISSSLFADHKHISVTGCSVEPRKWLLVVCLIISGDVHPCPGPAKLPCPICHKTVRSNSKAVSCDMCEKWVHLKCTSMDKKVYEHYAQSGETFSYSCNKCSISELPFSTSGDINNDPLKDDTPHQLPANEDQTAPDQCMWDCFRMNGMHFLHLNARSIIPKMDEIKLLVKNSRPAVLGITETWLDDSVSDSEIAIDDYVIIRKNRNREGGGVLMFIHKELAFNPRDDMNNNSYESIWIELLLPKTRPIIVGTCYRPPKENDFYSSLEETCYKSAKFMDSEVYILGDFNTNVACKSKSSLQISLSNFCNNFSLKQLITDYTRITINSKSIIDLIIVSDVSKVSQSGVIPIGISDHFLTYCTRKSVKCKFGKHNTVSVRSCKNYDPVKFKQKLNSVNWFDVVNCDDIESAWGNFKTLFMGVLDEVAPVKHVRVKQRTQPWMESNILESIQLRDKSLHMYKKSNDYSLWVKYKQLRNKVQYDIKKAKTQYFLSKINDNKCNSKGLWRTLKEMGMPSKSVKTASSKIGLLIDDEICFEEEKNAIEFNKFFTSIASTLVNKLPTSKGLFNSEFVKKFYCEKKGIVSDKFRLNVVSEDEICKIVNSIGANKATGLDSLPSRFIKDSCDAIISPLTHIVNLSLCSGKVPCDLKEARVVPLYKKKDKTDTGNYRPVSILSIISKVLEKSVYKQVEDYLLVNKLLFDCQSGFRSGFSTDTCLIHLTDLIRNEMDKGNYTGMVLLDLQKAFDTVDHSIMLQKLAALGFDNKSVSWFSSYLTDRRQCIDLNGTHSPFLKITCGVPQGSILGPLLFLIYVNDMEAAVSCKLFLYADDSALLVSGKCINTIEYQLSCQLQQVSEWLIDNKLSLHLGKTESILFASKPKLKKYSQLNITCNDIKIQSTASVTYLGAELDQSLSGEAMGAKIIKKSSSRLRYLYRKGKFLTSHAKKLLASALIQCHFDYASSFWYTGLTQKTKSKLQVTQNQIIRFILNLPQRAHIGANEFVQMDWLPVHYRVDHIKLLHMYKIINNLAPLYLTENITPIIECHKYNTRSSSHNLVINSYSSYAEKSFHVTGIKLWNNLEPSIKSKAANIVQFKKNVKISFMQKIVSDEKNCFLFY